MDLDEIEDLIRRYLSAGIAVVLILIAPGGGDEEPSPRNDPAIVTVTPSPVQEGGGTDLDTRGPADGSDPGSDPGNDDGGDAVAVDEEGPGAGTDTALPATTPRPTPRSADPDSDDTSTADPPADPDTADPDSADPDSADPDSADPDSADRGTDGDTADRSTSDAEATDPGSTDTDPADDPVPTTPRAPAPDTATGTSAATELGRGTPDREDDFTSGLSQWELYDGPGHAGRGMRSPSAATVQDGVLTITGDAAGTTAGMCWAQGQRYGRWEGRVRAPAPDPSYDALLLLWPDADSPAGGEIDFVEMQDPTRRTTDFFLHHGADDRQVTGQVEVDATQWHTWAVEWTAESISAFVDGERWFHTTDTATFPPGPMHLCVQLDWFPQGSGEVRESSMQVDWVRQYSLDTPG
ncbi:glycoside hydrolase family 16 protein [Pseudonocardia abyssalis]|uniref:glycoside hydrolase family 16 protein n=1 Tax=Pseudonocardia abyssalis TaxID=2792008 RepID=UPI001C4A348C|nr:glycoside hydrolase family 16 protein [Pseudonocardia abyssalis]MBW0115188.1 family 16 glycosylhydrolase [Pseudonocardia abyssalis]